MARAIKEISVQRGYSISDYALCCFGGAAGQHACLVADALGMTTVFLHPFAGVLSAYGMGLAELRAINQAAIQENLDGKLMPGLETIVAELEKKGRDELESQGRRPGRDHHRDDASGTLSRYRQHARYSDWRSGSDTVGF